MPVERCSCGWWAATWKGWEAKAMLQRHLKECPLNDDMPDDIEFYRNEKAMDIP